METPDDDTISEAIEDAETERNLNDAEDWQRAEKAPDPNVPVVTRESLAAMDSSLFERFRRTTLIKATPAKGPLVVHEEEGEVTLDDTWLGYIIIQEGWPVAVSDRHFREHYIPATTREVISHTQHDDSEHQRSYQELADKLEQDADPTQPIATQDGLTRPPSSPGRSRLAR